MPVVALVNVKVRRVPAELLLNVTTLPDVPVIVHVSMVPWLELRVMVCATVLSEASSLKEFAPPIVSVEVPVAPPMVSLL